MGTVDIGLPVLSEPLWERMILVCVSICVLASLAQINALLWSPVSIDAWFLAIHWRYLRRCEVADFLKVHSAEFHIFVMEHIFCVNIDQADFSIHEN